MANIFIDANLFFDIASRHKSKAKLIAGHHAYLSPLSCHVFCYSEKLKMPDKKLNELIENFEIINISKKILDESLRGPTTDLEDNIQLNSAKKAEADYFLTSDKNLLKLKNFGKVKIASTL